MAGFMHYRRGIKRKEVKSMAAFLFVTASMALLVGLVGLVIGHRPRRTGHQ
jgi:hypothetical protein